MQQLLHYKQCHTQGLQEDLPILFQPQEYWTRPGSLFRLATLTYLGNLNVESPDLR